MKTYKPEQVERLALQLLRMFAKKHLDTDLYIYANNRRFSTENSYHNPKDAARKVEKSKIFSYYVEENKLASDYDKYSQNFITITSEGEFYDLMYDYGPPEWFIEFLEKHELWHECDYYWAWSLFPRD